MRMRGMGRQRVWLVAAIVLVIALAVPGIGAPAGAATARPAGRAELSARGTSRPELAAKKRKAKKRKVKRAPMTAARRKALLTRYLKAHPGVLAQHLAATGKKAATKPLATKKKKPLKKKKKPAKKKKKPAKRTPAKKKKPARTAAKKAKPVKKHPLGTTGWTELFLIALLPFASVGGVLLGTDRLRRPRLPKLPSPAKRRRTLVITPMRHR